MKHLLKKVHVIDRNSPYNDTVVDILIENDQITAIGEGLTDAKAKTIELEGAFVSPGWVEMHSNFCDPGYEDREDIQSGAKAASAGGFTSVCLVPSTSPVVQNKADIEYLIKRGDNTPIHVYPLGAVSAQLKGEQLTEMFDMNQAGAVGFYDDKEAIRNPNLLKLAMLYSQEFAPILVHPRHPDLTAGGQMNEGATSTYIGLKGIPDFAEELMIARDLYIARYTNCPLHFAGISTKGSVDLIREAKQKGLAITADVNFYNLVLDDSVLKEYDTNYKVNPPLRELDDINALLEGLKDDSIDAIAIDHIPQDVERKRCEFDHAAYGMAAIETAFGAMSNVVELLGIETVISKLSNGPREILDLPRVSIREGSIAELSLFHPDQEWQLDNKSSKSRAANNPFLNKNLKGRVLGTFNKGKFYPN